MKQTFFALICIALFSTTSVLAVKTAYTLLFPHAVLQDSLSSAQEKIFQQLSEQIL